MPSTPIVSVITAMYNAEKFIGQTIQSVIDQTYLDWEMIIIDDRSTDNSLQIVKEYLDRDSRIKLIEVEKNFGGPARPRNIGIKEAKGEYIAFLDADDLWRRSKLSNQIDQLQKFNYKWNYCDVLMFENNSKHIIYKSKNFQNFNYEGILLKLYEDNFISSPTPVIHKSVFKETGLFNEKKECIFAEDWEMWLRIASKYPIGLVDKKLAFYRIHDTNNSAQIMNMSRLDRIIYVLDSFRKKDIRIDKSCFHRAVNKNVVPLFGYFVLNNMVREAKAANDFLRKKNFFSLNYLFFLTLFYIGSRNIQKILPPFKILKKMIKVVMPVNQIIK